MSTTKKLTATALVIAVVGSIGYVNRYPILLKFMEVAAPIVKPDIAPTREIAWEIGNDPLNRNVDDRPPNVVLILADDLGWNDITLNGGVANGTVPTPSIDSIAQQGVNFVNGYAANATCAPSRAAILSGRYPTRFGFEFTPTPPGMMQMTGLGAQKMHPDRPRSIKHVPESELDYEESGMPTGEITIAEALTKQGYHSVHIGKWHVGLKHGMGPLQQGFNESLLMSDMLYLEEEHPDVVNARLAFDPIDRFLWSLAGFSSSVDGGKTVFRPARYLTDYYTDEAVKVIEANRERPFFLYLAHWAVHTPLQALREDYEKLHHIELHRERVYAAMVMSLERSVARVLQALEDNGLSENTIVIFTSDNGGAPYIGLPDINAPYRGWKLSFFEGGIHVPFMVKWPGKIPAGTNYNEPVQHFDLFSTIVKAAGGKLPADRKVDGVDLLPFVLGKRSGAPHDALFFNSGASQSVIANGWKLNVSAPDGHPALHRYWLFNLADDPTEQHDLSAQHPDKIEELKTALAQHNAEQPPPSWSAVRSSPVSIDKDLNEPYEVGDEQVYWSN